MKRTQTPVMFCVFLLCLVFLFDTASSVLPPVEAFAATDESSSQSSSQVSEQSAIEKADTAFDDAEPILEKLEQMVAGENADTGADDKDAKFDVGKAEAMREELNGYRNQLDELLSDLAGLPDDSNTSEGKTVRAVREYLTMLRDMSADMYELVGYSIDLFATLQAIGNLESETEDYVAMAEQIGKGIGAAMENMEKINPPAYLAISHSDLAKRIQEFKDFSVDLDAAVEISDPLRTFSCIFRMKRIMMMFTRSVNNLNGDIELQFNQADRRLKGPIATLHDELSSNLDLLQAA